MPRVYKRTCRAPDNCTGNGDPDTCAWCTHVRERQNQYKKSPAVREALKESRRKWLAKQSPEYLQARREQINRINRERWANDPEYREYHREYQRKWQAKKQLEKIQPG